ncbi:MAG: hypothetical protein LBR94_08880 [Desulfovibrio sp.]|jgi:hypothetical protein|nr:hypothetical protein [Desulfovibrio sp.]
MFQKTFTRAEILAALEKPEVTEAAVDVSAAVKMYSNLWAKQVEEQGRNGVQDIQVTLPEPENEAERVALELFMRVLEDATEE